MTVSIRRLCAAAFAAPLLLTGARSASPEQLLYVSNELPNTISAIAPHTNTVVATIAVGKRPRGMALSPDRRTVYVALGEDDALGVVDVASAKQTQTIPAGRDPELVVLSPDGKIAYVSNEEIAHASAIDIASGKTLFSTPVGVEPEGVGITRDGTKLYVTAETNSTVSVLDAKTGRLLK